MVKVRNERARWVSGTEIIPLCNQGLGLSRHPWGKVPTKARRDVAARHLPNNAGEGRRPEGGNSGGREGSEGGLRIRPECIPIRSGEIGVGPPKAFGRGVSAEVNDDGKVVRVEVGGG